MALEIILAVRNARARDAGAWDENADVEIVHGSRQHKDLMAVLTTKNMQSMLAEGGNGEKDGKAGDASIPFAVRADKLLQRMLLEHGMLSVAIKLPLFVLCMVCFVWAISLLSPASSMSTVHQQLISHFDVTTQRFGGMRSFNDVYNFIEDFEAANRGLQASSASYWCEKRYFQYTWNMGLLLPDRSCPSPRLAALGFKTDTPTKWTTWATGSASSGSSSGAAATASSASSAASSAGHRRLAAARRAAGAASSAAGSASAAALPPCEDNDAELQVEEGDPNITCNNSASHTCEIDLGVVLCPKTCGYCAPFEYEHSRFFDRPQVTMLPVMVHQTRYATTDCGDFGATFENQPYNRDLVTLPPLDGERHSRVLTCIDRNKHFTDEFAFQLECPKVGAPELFCTNGTMPYTKVHTYHGMPVYSQFLTEPAKNIAAMRAVDWLDGQTESITVSTLVYTEHLEIFTSISASFQVDAAGSIKGHSAMVSYTDLTRDRRTTFIVLLVLVCIGSFIGVALNAWQLFRSHHCQWGLQTFELFSRASMCVYALVLLITWLKQIPMAEEFDHLLHAVLDFHGHGHAEFEKLVQTYFDAKTLIYEETQWLMSHRTTIYIILYVQFAQLIAYFAVHPRLAMLTSTISGALDHMVHFFVLFAIIFVFLAFLASWMLGGDVHAFQTFGEAVASQGKMLFGEWIYADNADDLHGAMVGMYWIYALSFMLVLFFTLLNFFLAIVVEAFVKVKSEIMDDPTEQNVAIDVVDMIGLPFRFMLQKWGTHSALSGRLGAALDDQGWTAGPQVWHVKQLMEILPPKARNAESLTRFLRHYAAKCPIILTVGADAAKALKVAEHHVDPLAKSLDEAFHEAALLLSPAVHRAFGYFGDEATWSYEKVEVGAHIVHRVSANFVREREGDQMPSAAEMIVGSAAAVADRPEEGRWSHNVLM